MFMSPDEFPLPWEYREWTFDGLVGRAARGRGRAHDRVPRLRQHRPHAGGLPPARRAPHPQHRPPPRQHALRHGQPRGAEASCTAEIVWRLAKELGAEITPRDRRRALHRPGHRHRAFMYENTTPEAHRMAAELIEAGRRAARVYRRLYEDLPFRRLQLLQRALASVERHDDGAITIAHLVKDDYEETGALETDSEGMVDHMRAVEGTARGGAGARAARRRPRRQAQGEPARHRRARGRVAHRARARRRRPPAGRRLHHRAAVPASWWRSCASRWASSSATDTARGPAHSQAGGGDLARRGGRGAARAPARHEGRATPGTLDPFATGLLLVLVGRATRAQRFLMGLPKTYRAVARLGWRSDTGDRDGGCSSRPAGSRSAWSCRPASCMQRPPAYSAVKVGGERAYARARRGEEVETQPAAGDRAPRRAAVARGRARGLRDRVLRRAPTCARWSPTSATPTARSSSAPRSGRSGSRTPTPTASCRSTRRSPSCRSGRSSDAEAVRVRHGRRVARRGRRAARAAGRGRRWSRSPSRALSELQPVVVFEPA